MFRLARRLLARAVRGFHAVIHRLVGRRARRAARSQAVERRAQLLLSPMETRDHTGNLAGGLALAALGYQLTDPLEAMAVAVGDLALLAAPDPTGGVAPTVGDPPRPLTAWLADEPLDLGPAANPDTEGVSSTGIEMSAGVDLAGSDDPLADAWAIPVAAAAGPVAFPDPLPGDPNAGASSGDANTAPAAGDSGGSGGSTFGGLGPDDLTGTPLPLAAAPDASGAFGGSAGTNLPDDAFAAAMTVAAATESPTDAPVPNTSAVPSPTMSAGNTVTAPPANAPVLTAVYRFGEGDGARVLVEGTTTGGTANAITFLRGGNRVGTASATASAGGSATFRAVLPAAAAGGTLVAVQGGIASAPAVAEAGAGPDGDADGVPDWVEALAPGAAAAGNASRAGVASLPAAVGGAFVTVDAGARALGGVRALAAPTGVDAATFPLGLYAFEVRDVAPGGAATVRLVLPAGERPTRYLKWDAATGRVTDFAFDGTTGATFDGNVVTLHLVDGGRGDADGLANGTIVDPGGPSTVAVPLVQVVAPDPTAAELGSTALFRVQRVGPTGVALTVGFRLGGDALSNAHPGGPPSSSGFTGDYHLDAPGAANLAYAYDPDAGAVVGTVDIPAGQRTVGIRVLPSGDGIDEWDDARGSATESVAFALLPATRYTIDPALPAAAATIVDVDQPFDGPTGGSSGTGSPSHYAGPAVTVRAVDPTAAENGDEWGSTAGFEVRRHGDTSGRAEVWLRALSKSTATFGAPPADVDLPRYSLVYFAPGQAVAMAGILPRSDTRLEGPETLWVEVVPPPGEMEGRVWEDLDADGIREPGEPGLSGVAVARLSPMEGTGATTTDGDGRYRFAGLTTNTHSLLFTAPLGYLFTQPNVGPDDGRDSDADPTNGWTGYFTTPVGNPYLYGAVGGTSGWDAGLYRLAEVRGTAWIDADGNGIRSGEEAAELDVVLYNAAGTPLTSTTAIGGAYAFTGLVPGNYSVRFLAPDLSFTRRDVGEIPGGPDPEADSDAGTDGRTAAFALRSGEVRSLDAGVLGGLGDYVWEDRNADGVQDPGEPGLPGVTVTLAVPGEAPQVTTTDDHGLYHFPTVPTGPYTVTVTKPGSAYAFSPRGKGPGPATDSDADANGVITPEPNGGAARADLDAGLYRPAAVTGYVWTDRNGDGVRTPDDPDTPDEDEGDGPLVGFTVTLRDKYGRAVGQPVTTGSDGSYAFPNLVPGEYSVRVTKPEELRFTRRFAEDDPDADSDVDSGGTTHTFPLASGEVRSHTDAGLFRPVTVGDTVWADDGDHVWEEGEPGVGGVDVALLGWNAEIEFWALERVETTSSDGKYAFEGVAPGKYKLAFDEPAGRVFVTAKQGGNGQTDSDPDESGVTAEFTVTSGEDRLDLDAGLVAGIAGYAWDDTDADGTLGESESKRDGVSVTLQKSVDAKWVTVTTMTTADGGRYRFVGMADGEYRVSFAAPTGYLFSTPADGLSPPIPVAGGVGATDRNAGVYLPATITGVAWEDRDADGKRDADVNGTPSNQIDPALPGVAVTLYDADGKWAAGPVPTGTDGSYAFPGLKPGWYSVAFQTPTGAALTRAGGDSAPDPDTKAAWVELAGGDAEAVNAGAYYFASVGDRVWEDVNGNGIQDDGSTGVADVTVILTDGTGSTRTTTTGSGGAYSFSEVVPGAYALTFVTPTGWRRTLVGAGTSASDSDANPLSGQAAVTLASRDARTDIDAGMYRPILVSGRVWRDWDGDGQRDSGEKGRAGTGIELRTASGAVYASTTTWANGGYTIEARPGASVLAVVGPTGFVLPNQGSDATDSDVSQPDGTLSLNLASGDAPVAIDAGVTVGVIEGMVWRDVDRSGSWSTGDQGFVGVTVNLTRAADGWTGSVTTEASPAGLYRLEVDPGTYTVSAVRPYGYVTIAPAVPYTVPVGDGETVAGGHFFLAVEQRTISGLVWNDTDPNGQYDPANEDVRVGWPVRLYRNNALFVSTTTDAAGAYSFLVDLGNYEVRADRPTGYAITHPPSGVHTVTLNSGQDVPDVRFGVHLLPPPPPPVDPPVDPPPPAAGSASGFVWYDAIVDGLQTGEESNGVPDVGVELLYAAGGHAAYATTDGAGAYRFTTVAPGQYKLRFTLPSSYDGFTIPNNSPDTIDSDVVTNTDTDPFTVSAGGVAKNDAGLVRYGSGSGYQGYSMTSGGPPLASGYGPSEPGPYEPGPSGYGSYGSSGSGSPPPPTSPPPRRTGSATRTGPWSRSSTTTRGSCTATRT